MLQKLWLFCLCFIFFTSALTSEAKSINDNKQALSLTAMGPATWWSIGFENNFKWKKKWNLGLELAFSTHQLKDFHNEWNPNLQLPLKVSFRYGNIHQFGIGFGGTTTRIVKFAENSKFDSWNFNPFFSLDYRYYFKEHFYLAGGFYMLYSPKQKKYLWPGLTFAWVF